VFYRWWYFDWFKFQCVNRLL